MQVGDAGVWVTCQRGKERQARSEMARICDDVRMLCMCLRVPRASELLCCYYFCFVFISNCLGEGNAFALGPGPFNVGNGGRGRGQGNSRFKASFTDPYSLSQYGKKLYGIDLPDEAAAGEDEDEGGADDIEASIQKELEGMKPANRPKDPPFETVRSGLDCLFFLRTRPPVDPIEFARQVCLDAAKPAAPPMEEGNEGENGDVVGRGSSSAATAVGISRFVNRFTPVTVLGRATDKSLDELARKVLAEHFRLADGSGGGGGEDKDESDAPSVSHSCSSFTGGPWKAVSYQMWAVLSFAMIGADARGNK